jgi:hypothetical protein
MPNVRLVGYVCFALLTFFCSFACAQCPGGRCLVPSTMQCGEGECGTVYVESYRSPSGLGSAAYARFLNSGRFRHDPRWNGYEVIYRSSGTATEAQARDAWMRSPGHRALLVGGRITEIACVGKACVGRGLAAGSRAVGAVAESANTVRRVQPVRSTFKRWFR